MKKLFVLLALLISTQAFATQVSYKIGDGTTTRVLFDITKELKLTTGLNYQDVHGKLEAFGNSVGLTGSVLIPAIGIEFTANKTQNLDTIVGLEYQHVLPSVTIDGNSTASELAQKALNDITVNCLSAYVGLNYNINPTFAITGTTGIRLINASYDKNSIKLNAGVNSMYTQIGMLVTL